jgi:hypothetical protein
LAFEIKHFFCDFVFQTKWQIDSKKTYGALGGIVHATLHGLGSVPALYLMGVQPWLLIAIPLGELVLHYHIDWAKARVDVVFDLPNTDVRYWIVFGFDQLLHQLTYLGIVAWLAGVL